MSDELHNTRETPPGDSPAERYLWDRSGPPDALVQRLETLLAPLRHDAAAPPVRHRSSPRWWIPGVFIAAAAAVLAVVLWPSAPVGESGWTASPVAGEPSLGESVLHGGRAVPLGEWVVTDALSKAVLQRSGLGRVTLDPQGRLRVVKSAPSEQRLELARGRISAVVSAPPELFFVDTPAATAIDMGCAYTLDVADNGDGLLDVTSGWVVLVSGGLESRVPAGGVCTIAAGVGPGTPYRRDATGALIEALARFDAGSEAAVDDVLNAAERRDGVTLWHLLPRTARATRERVAARLAALVPAEDVDVKAALALDSAALEKWWTRVHGLW